jgi:hypothetical protein
MDLLVCAEDPDVGNFCATLCDVGNECVDGQLCVDAGYPEPMGYCPPTQVACDPVANQQCGASEACYYFNNLEPRVQCTAPGANHAGEGEGCASSEQCNPTLTCFEGTCLRLCHLNLECDNGDLCEDMGFGFLDYGVCPPGPGACNPVSGDGCDNAAMSCYFNPENDGTRACFDSGINNVGQDCGDHFECAPGLVCTDYDFSGVTTCQALCNDIAPCDATHACGFATGFLPGVCLKEESCDPFIPETCSGSLTCTILNDLGEVACIQPGVRGFGEDCDLFRPCAAGYGCDNAGSGNRVCRRVCNTEAPDCLGEGTICQPMNWPALPNVGICK